ncbi:hypothetical protein [Halobacillus mangrovi]|nr:hypothetical protein [Halobacillus mangrovi]
MREEQEVYEEVFEILAKIKEKVDLIDKRTERLEANLTDQPEGRVKNA